MIKYAVASGLLALVLGFTINSQDTCSCDQYYTSAECDRGLCKWNSTLSICTTLQCSQLSQYNCYSTKNTCYWNANSSECLVLSSCSQLKGNSYDDCKSQNLNCDWVSGSSCSDAACQNYNAISCPRACYNNGNSCQEYTSCSEYTINNCPFGLICFLDNNTCVPAQCQMFPANLCLFVATFPQAGISQLTPCYLNESQYCQNATQGGDFTSPLQCNFNTAGLYHWSSNNQTQGSCVACQQASSSSASTSTPSESSSPAQGLIVQIMIAIVLLIA